MSEIREELYYSKEHEWVRVEDNDIAVVGITDYAQSELGDIVMFELPEEDEDVEQGEIMGTVEAVKTVSRLYSPVTGEVIEINEEALDNPGIVNEDPYEEGWLIKVKMEDPDELNNLISAEEYKQHIGEG